MSKGFSHYLNIILRFNVSSKGLELVGLGIVLHKSLISCFISGNFRFGSLRDPCSLDTSPPLSASLLNAWLPENAIDPIDVTEIQNELESASLLALFETGTGT
jgi:hypothetical protein